MTSRETVAAVLEAGRRAIRAATALPAQDRADVAADLRAMLERLGSVPADTRYSPALAAAEFARELDALDVAIVLRALLERLAELERVDVAGVDQVVRAIVDHLRAWRHEAVAPLGTLPRPEGP